MSDLQDAVDRLGNVGKRDDAVRLLASTGAEAILVLRQGMTHPCWRVRHMCCRLLDDLPLGADVFGELRDLARRDPNKRIRHQAWHAATCEPCKPSGLDRSCGVDPLDDLSDQLGDRSLRVRRGAATGLIFAALNPASDAGRLDGLIGRVLANETDATMSCRAARARRLLATHISLIETLAPPGDI